MERNSSLRYLHLDVSNTPQNNKYSKHSSPSRESWGYSPDFNIQTSWVGKSHDTLRESMLAYSKKMSDIRRIRGINILKSNQPDHKPPFLMHTNRGALDLGGTHDYHNRKSYPNFNQRSYRSLGTIKLEPLLGSQKVIPNLEETVAIQVCKVNKHAATNLHHHKEDEIEEHLAEANEGATKQIRLTINMPLTAGAEPEDDEEGEGDEEGAEEPPQEKKKLIPLGSNKERPRKAKRMKLAKPSLEAISEDSINIELKENATPVDLRTGYANLLNEVSHSHERMLEQKRQTIALLKQTNQISQTRRQLNQSMLQSYAKRKLRKLPPIPVNRPSLRYSSGEHGQNSVYSHIQV